MEADFRAWRVSPPFLSPWYLNGSWGSVGGCGGLAAGVFVSAACKDAVSSGCLSIIILDHNVYGVYHSLVDWNHMKSFWKLWLQKMEGVHMICIHIYIWYKYLVSTCEQTWLWFQDKLMEVSAGMPYYMYCKFRDVTENKHTVDGRNRMYKTL